MDPVVAKKVNRYFYLFISLLLIPSFFFLVTSLKSISEKNILENFIKSNIHDDVEKGAQWTFRQDSDSVTQLRIYYFGAYISPDSVLKLEQSLKVRLKENLLNRFTIPDSLMISLTPTDSPPDEERQQLSEEITAMRLKMLSLEQIQTGDLETKITELDSLKQQISTLVSDSLPFAEISKEVKAVFPELSSFSISKAEQTNFDSLGKKEVITALVRWDKTVYKSLDKREKQARIKNFISVKLNNKVVEVVNY
jgi:hypothetical protein